MHRAASPDPARGRATMWAAAVVSLALLVSAACASDPAGDGPDTSAFIVQVDPTATVDPDTLTNDTTGGADATEDDEPEGVALEGTVINPFDLTDGDCFNEYVFRDRAENLQQITSRVDCARPHDREVYSTTNHPAGPDTAYPGDTELIDFANDHCLEAFEEFVGTEYILSALEFATLRPTFESWNGAGRHRGVICFLFPFEGGLLQGSMAQSRI